MHDQRIDGPVPPAHETREHRVQRKLLLELVLAPPPFTDDLTEIAPRIGERRADVEEALAALAQAGLAGRAADVVWATPAARYSEALFPMCP